MNNKGLKKSVANRPLKDANPFWRCSILVCPSCCLVCGRRKTECKQSAPPDINSSRISIHISQYVDGRHNGRNSLGVLKCHPNEFRRSCDAFLCPVLYTRGRAKTTASRAHRFALWIYAHRMYAHIHHTYICMSNIFVDYFYFPVGSQICCVYFGILFYYTSCLCRIDTRWEMS